MIMKRWIFIFACLVQAPFLLAQSYTVSGYIKDLSTGETLIGANVYDASNVVNGAYSNNYGFYSLTLPAGKYILKASYLGYQDQAVEIDLQSDIRQSFDLSSGVSIEEVVVLGEEPDRNVESTEMGTVDLTTKQIKRLPALLGEVDVLKTIQLLPGVSSVGEGNSGFYVRGGGADQNLVLLDEAVVYNTGHMLGFFSVFNADAIKNTTLIKGGMPAQYGGRISSVLDIQMNEGNNKGFAAQGGVGIISSRLTVEGPIVKDKTSFIASGRRTYALDLAQPAINNTSFAGTNYYFYDFNAKVNHTFSDQDRLYLSGYFGRDVLSFNSNDRGFSIRLPYGNSTATLRWNHLFSDKHFANFSIIYNDYDFTFTGEQEEFKFEAQSGVRDWTAKADFEWYPNTKHTLRYGISSIHHKLSPNMVSATNGETEFMNDFESKYGLESGVYISDDWKINERFAVNIGMRVSNFSQLGPYTSKIDGEAYEATEVAKTYWGLEPRVGTRVKVDPSTSIKASFARTYQYIHLVSNSGSTLPADVWVPSTEIVKPQIGMQYGVGLFKNFQDNMFETSIELYYKDLYNQIDYRDSYVNTVSREVEDDFVFGEGRAYGMELFLKKAKGDFTGWIGYTLSRTERWFDEIEDGRVYPAVFDRTHDISIVGSYRLSKKWDFSAAFIYGTGRAFTPVESVYLIENKLAVEYAPRNSGRFPDYHRLDLSATYTPKPDSKKNFTSYWTFSIYNVYNRLNPFFTFTDFSSDPLTGGAAAEGVAVSLFPIIPSVTWNFKWNQKNEK